MIDSSELMRLMMLNTMGMSVLHETIIHASRARFTGPDSMRTETQQSFMFIQGTGLDKLIERFDLGYDADALRLAFNYYFRHQ